MDKEIEELKQRAGITEEHKSSKMKAWMDAQTMFAMMEDLEQAALDGMVSAQNMSKLRDRALSFARNMEEHSKGRVHGLRKVDI